MYENRQIRIETSLLSRLPRSKSTRVPLVIVKGIGVLALSSGFPWRLSLVLHTRFFMTTSQWNHQFLMVFKCSQLSTTSNVVAIMPRDVERDESAADSIKFRLDVELT